MFSHQVAKWCWELRINATCLHFVLFYFLIFIFFFLKIDIQIRNKNKWFFKKKVIFMYDDSKQGRVVVQKRMNAKNFSWNTRETDKGNVEILLLTQPTTRQRYGEVKKKAWQRTTGQQQYSTSFQSTKDSVWVGGGTWTRSCSAANAAFPPTISLIAITPSSLLHQTRTRPRSRSTRQQCAVTGWWPRHCQRARA